MRVGAVWSTEVFKIAEVCREIKADPWFAPVDVRENFEQHVRQWMVLHHPDRSEGFVEFVVGKAWAAHIADTARVELTTSEIHHLLAVVDTALANTPRVALTAAQAKLRAGADRLATPSTDDPATEPEQEEE